MSDLLKALSTPQFTWYNKWTSLGPDGLPDRAIADGLKQPDRIKISFTVNGKELTGSVAPDQARFGPEFFLAQTLPDFESKVVSRLPANKQRDGPTLFPLLEQCFQEVGLTEWSNVVSARCPDDASKTYENFVECQRDYLEALARFPNIGDQLIRWFRTARKPALMPMHDYMRRRVQLVGYLEKGLLRATMELPTKTEKIEQIFFSMPRKHQQKYAETHKTLPDDHVTLVCFFEQCQNADRANGVLDQLQKEKTEKAAKKTSTKKPRERGSKTSRRDRRRARSYDRNDRHDHHGYRRHDRNDRDGRGHRHDRSDRNRDKAAYKHDHRNDRDGKHRGHEGKNDDRRRHDKDKHHVMHNDDASKRSRSVSTSRGRSTSSRGSSVRSRSASSSRSVVNHHMDEQGTASPRHPKRTHSYSEDDDEGNRHVPQEGDSIYATFAAPSKKSKKSRRKTA